MTGVRRYRRIASVRLSAHVSPDQLSAPIPGDHASARAPRDDGAVHLKRLFRLLTAFGHDIDIVIRQSRSATGGMLRIATAEPV